MVFQYFLNVNKTSPNYRSCQWISYAVQARFEGGQDHSRTSGQKPERHFYSVDFHVPVHCRIQGQRGSKFEAW